MKLFKMKSKGKNSGLTWLAGLNIQNWTIKKIIVVTCIVLGALGGLGGADGTVYSP